MFQRLLEDYDEDDEIELPHKLPTQLAEAELLSRSITPPQPVPAPVPAPSRSKPRIKTLKLSEITKPLSSSNRSIMITAAVNRILKVAQRFPFCYSLV